MATVGSVILPADVANPVSVCVVEHERLVSAAWCMGLMKSTEPEIEIAAPPSMSLIILFPAALFVKWTPNVSHVHLSCPIFDTSKETQLYFPSLS